MQNLSQIINRIDGKGYKAYKQLKGSYNFDHFTLYIDHVQGDPFAAPSKLRARVYQSRAKFNSSLFSNKSRKTALQDFITRAFNQTIKDNAVTKMGSGKSGLISIDCGNQQILERTSCTINDQYVQICFYVGLPARGRRILGSKFSYLLTQIIPEIVSCSMFYQSLDSKACHRFIEVNEDQDLLRSQLRQHNIISFIANGSILPRRSGISDKPLAASEAVPFKSPPQLEVTLETSRRGKIKGMGLPEGITLIIGGGFHGKTTLLSAIEVGIYNHIPGDGREYSVTVGGAVKIRAEEGRNIQKVNISPFINNLPFGKNTQKFSTANASGSTSQAANIIEALELKASMLLLDEDTSATNFLIRDEVMQKIVTREKEPITPFIDQVRNMYNDYCVSTIMVMGGAGDYFEVADQIILMDSYIPRLVTDKAKKIISQKKDKRVKEAPPGFGAITERIPQPQSINPYKGRKRKIKSRGLNQIIFGFENIDLSAIEQIVDSSQVNAISDIIYYAVKNNYIDGQTTLNTCLKRVFNDIESQGLAIISPYGQQHPGSYALPRKYEVGSAINRLRSLKVHPQL